VTACGRILPYEEWLCTRFRLTCGTTNAGVWPTSQNSGACSRENTCKKNRFLDSSAVGMSGLVVTPERFAALQHRDGASPSDNQAYGPAQQLTFDVSRSETSPVGAAWRR